MLEKEPAFLWCKKKRRSLALYKKKSKMFSEARVALFSFILSKLNSKKPACNVSQRLYSRTKRNALLLEKEIFVNEIKHFRVSIEGSPIKKAVILSESALQNDQYKALENKSKI